MSSSLSGNEDHWIELVASVLTYSSSGRLLRTTELDCQAFRDQQHLEMSRCNQKNNWLFRHDNTTSTMSLTMRPTLLPQCTSCLRRISSPGLQEWRSGQQVRGKKKMAHAPTTVTVRLTKDVPTFGRKGTYVPISIGRMRNEFFPTRTAEYVTPAQLKEMKAKNITAERDFQFGVPDPAAVRAIEQQSQRSAKRTVEVEKLAVSLVLLHQPMSSVILTKPSTAQALNRTSFHAPSSSHGLPTQAARGRCSCPRNTGRPCEKGTRLLERCCRPPRSTSCSHYNFFQLCNTNLRYRLKCRRRQQNHPSSFREPRSLANCPECRGCQVCQPFIANSCRGRQDQTPGRVQGRGQGKRRRNARRETCPRGTHRDRECHCSVQQFLNP